MGARDNGNVMAGEGVLADADLAGGEIEERIHHFTAGGEMQSIGIAPNPNLGVDDRLDGGTESVEAQSPIDFLLLSIGQSGDRRGDNFLGEGGEQLDAGAANFLFKPHFVTLQDVHDRSLFILISLKAGCQNAYSTQ
jgi:hypothetical protein